MTTCLSLPMVVFVIDIEVWLFSLPTTFFIIDIDLCLFKVSEFVSYNYTTYTTC